ncbi:MAG TPA: glycogen/starch/alpha-glucan phosphorylase, partial [Anaeromyxobacteraceae bacterium]|nr:glycogen/starch/alpha-glucan phosphorylase [Anaeromyxobacteraceae bacterium]
MAAQRKPSTAEARALQRARDLPNARTAADVDSLRRSFLDHLQFSQGKDEHTATALDRYFAIAHSVRDRLMKRWIQTQQAYYGSDAKRVYYLSLEFLMGKALENNLINLGLYNGVRDALSGIDWELADLAGEEPDAGLGNGGLGRLAACYLDSMATLALPASGYGIRYEFGIFDQDIREGWQVERPEEWLKFGNPWEVARPEYEVPVAFYGRTVHELDDKGRPRVRWTDAKHVHGTPYDTPIAGYRNGTVNTLRLWRARAHEELDLADFNRGDYLAAVEDKNVSENISKVLYPNDVTVMGKELRLQQQYFFVACSLHDIVVRHLKTHSDFATFADKVAIQLNDTHPAIAIAELMRVFVDERGFEWDRAWETCQKVFGYTNHTLLPEALERWPVDLFGRVLPRHLEIIYAINHKFLDEVRVRGMDEGAVQRMSLIEEGPVRQVRMANLAVVGSHSVNGVAGLHTELLKTDLFHDFHALWPERFNNKTNGVTPRRWMVQANPELSAMITEVIGPGWETDLRELRRLEPLADDARFRGRFREVKRANKERLKEIVQRENGITLDVDAMFDVQVKRLHEYKRQLLNVLHIVAQYLRIKADPSYDPVPRAYLFGAKAAPGYAMAKWHIKLINSVADVVNRDIDVRGRIAVVFLKNYRVSLAERIFPAADLSEQISTAGKEASGTGNMKLALNGALTIGTLDGANIEIREHVGVENIAIFGMEAGDVMIRRKQGLDATDLIRKSPQLARAINAIGSGEFSPDEPSRFESIAHALRYLDHYMVSADFDSYYEAQRGIDARWQVMPAWTRASILNVARMAWFSSDRTIR